MKFLVKATVSLIAGSALCSTIAGTAATPLPRGSWTDHGFSNDQRGSIQEAFNKGIDNQYIPGGALMIIHKGEVILEEGFGFANLETKKPFTPDALCRIASLTKPHTATMIGILSHQGKLSFADPVDKYIPEFGSLKIRALNEPVESPTLAQCLSHTTGWASNDQLKAGRLKLNLDGNLESVTKDLSMKVVFHPPGTNYAYSRLGYMTAGRVAEIVTGMSYQEAMKTVLFDAIGANDSTFVVTESVMKRMATPYERTQSGFRIRTGDPMGTAINPGGNLITNLDGVARLFMLHRNKGTVGSKRIISEEKLQTMYVGQPGTENSGSGYGLGFRILKKRTDGTSSRVQHTGAAGTIGILDFDLDLIVIVLTQVPQTQTNKWRNPLLRTIFAAFEN